MYQSTIVRITLHIIANSLATAYGLDSFSLCKGPIDVTLGILRGVECLVVSLIEWDVLFQPVWQIGL